MIRKTIFAIATVAAIGAAALIPTEASAGGGGKGGGGKGGGMGGGHHGHGHHGHGHHGHWGHGYRGYGFGNVAIGSSCWLWIRGRRVYVCS